HTPMGDLGDRCLRSVDGADVPRRDTRGGDDDGRGPVFDGPDLRPAWHGAIRAFPYVRALHRQLVDVQLRWNLRRFVGTVHRHVAREDLRAAVRRLLSLRGSGLDPDWAARDARNEGRRPLISWV